MKILMLSPTLGDAYGQERVMRDSSRLLREEGHKVYFLGDVKTGEIPACEGSLLIPGLSSLHSLTHPFSATLKFREAVKFITDIEPDIIHFIDQFDYRLMQWAYEHYPCLLTAHTVAPSCPASHRLIEGTGPCEKKSGWSCLVHDYSYHCLSQFKSPLHRIHALQNFYLKKKVTMRLPVIGAISRYTKAALVHDGWPEERVHLIYNPVEVAPPKAPIENVPENLIVAACRLVPLKGLEHLIRAVKSIEHLPWTLWICGEGDLKISLKALAAELGLSRRIEFLGHTSREATQRILAAAKVVAQPNVGPEGFGLTIAEASSLGIPVVAFDVPALNEIIEDGKSGLLVTPKDDAGLGHAIQRILQDPALHQALGEGGKLRMREHYSPQVHLAQTLAAYHTCLINSGPQTPFLESLAPTFSSR